VILQVFTDARQIVHHGNVELLQQIRRADTGALQDLRRSDGTRAEQHFAARMHLLRRIAGTVQILHAHRPLAVEQNAIGGGMGDDGQVGALLRGIKIAARGARATPFRRHKAIHRAKALLLIAVEILSARIARLHARFDHRGKQRVVARFAGGDADRAFAAMVVVRADIACFRLAVVRQAVEIGPALQPRLLRPVIKIHRVAAHIAHAVDQ